MKRSLDSAVASVIARWLEQRVSGSGLPLRLNLRLLFGAPAVAAAVRAELEARSDERRRFFVRTSEDDDAVLLRHGRPVGVGPATTVVYVLFWLPGSDGHARNAQSLQDLRGIDVHALLGDEQLVLDGERRIEEQIGAAAAAWTSPAHQARAAEHLGVAWGALRRGLRFRRGGREGSVPFVRSLESWLRFLERAGVPDDVWAATPDAQRPAEILVRWGRALPELGLFQVSELASVLGVTTDTTQAVPQRSKTGEARWPAALHELLAQNLEAALDPTGLGEQIAGKSSVADQLDKVLPKVRLCRDGDLAAARTALERFCLESDERALGIVEWLFHENRDNRRSPSMGVRGVLVARRSERARRPPLARAIDETIDVFQAWLGEKTQEMDAVRDHVHQLSGKGAPGFQALAGLLDAVADGTPPEEPAELRKALEKALAAPAFRGETVRRLSARWRRLRQGATREREVEAQDVLSGLVELVRMWRADEAPAAMEGEKLIVRFEERNPVELELSPATQGAAAVRDALARFLLEKVRAEAFPEEQETGEADDASSHELTFVVERGRQRERELIGRLRVQAADAARELWRATCRSPLPRWRLQIDAGAAGGHLLRQVCKAIAREDGVSGVQADELNATWSAYVRQAGPRGTDLLAMIAPIPASARAFVEAWAAALHPIVDAASAGSTIQRLADLEVEADRALEADDFARAKELRRLARELRDARTPAQDHAPAQARALLSLAAAEILNGEVRSRFLLTPHHPLVLRLRGVADDFLAGLLAELWAGGWQSEGADDLKEALHDWGLPEPTHAWCAWDGEPLVFEAWLDGGSAVYTRLGASREDDAGSLGFRAVADVVQRYRELNPLAADRLKLRIHADRDGQWAQQVIEEGLGARSFSADIDIVTDLPERSLTALERQLVRDPESAEAFELGADGTLPRVRMRRIRDEAERRAGEHLALIVGEKIDALAAEWQWQPAAAPPDGGPASVWDPAVLFDMSLPQVAGVVDLVTGPQDSLSVRAALAMGLAKGSQAGTIPAERQSFDPSRCEVPIVAAQGSAHWLVLASRRPLYRAVQQLGPRVATLLDFKTRLERGRPVHVCISLGARHAPNDMRGLAGRLRDLVGEADASLAPAVLRRAQKVAPELALRCLGTGGGAELIGLVGLLLAAHWLEEQGGEGVALALDQHRGLLTSKRRGDLLRVSEVRGTVRLQVCEAKCSTLPLSPTSAPMQQAAHQIEETIRGLARLGAQHSLSVRTRLELARALVQQAHMLGTSTARAAEMSQLVAQVANPTVPIEVEAGGHVALGFSLAGDGEARAPLACGEMRLFGRASTLGRLEAMARSS